ncbi:hypothetical protein AB1Y20_008745 [Prymnesium parvum]|uniref:STI1/HOP DP domain-containing protein n=1 Tax=Prymnesium parvum TaxID=97485 RepID=A0AB34IT99_PRYPA
MSYLEAEDLMDEGEVPPLLAAPPTKSAAPPPAPPASSVGAPRSKPPQERGGLKKGFLAGPAKAEKPKAAAAGEEMATLKADGRAKAKSLELPEVQQRLAHEREAASGGGGSNSWVTAELMQKIGANPTLRKAFTDPRCQEAMAALQADPRAAMEKYGTSAEMREFIRAFMELMAEHFTALAEKQEAAGGEAAGKGGAAAAAIAPAKSAEERKAEAAVQEAMRNPEVVAILQEPQVQAVLGRLQAGRAHELDAEMRRDPALVAKLRKLSEAGLIGMHWAP